MNLWRRRLTGIPTPARLTICVAIFCLVTAVCGWLLLSTRYDRNAKQTVQDFARELPAASAPRDRTFQLVDSTPLNLSPAERFATIYLDVRRRWQHLPDPIGQDHFKDVEETLLHGLLTGDCEDQTAVYIAVSKALGIPSRIILGRKANDGHVWTELLVSKESNLSPKVSSRLMEIFQTGHIVRRTDGYWLQLEDPSNLDGFKTEYFIDVLGNLHSINEIEYDD